MKKISLYLISTIALGLLGAYIAHYLQSDITYYLLVYAVIIGLLLTIKQILNLIKESKLISTCIGPQVICTVGIWMVISEGIDLLCFNPIKIEINDILFTFVATMHGIYEYYNLKELTLKNKYNEFRK